MSTPRTHIGENESDRSASPAAPVEVLVVDDDKAVRRTFKTCFEAIGCRVDEAANAPAVRAAIEHNSYELVLLDVRLGRDNGLDILPTLLARSPRVHAVVTTAFSSVAGAVEAIRHGARDYLPKPLTPAQLQQLVERVAAERALDFRSQALHARLGQASPDLDLNSESPRMHRTLDLVARASRHDAPVLLRGEDGTGRTALARRLHALSGRSSARFVAVGCKDAGEALLCSLLVGTGEAAADQMAAAAQSAGVEGGTLCLDEIGDLSPSLQIALLRFLERHREGAPGASRPSDVRVIATSSRDLHDELRAGRLVPELPDRFLEIEVPPLRERREDILPLARRFLAFFCRAEPLPPPVLTTEAEAALVAYDWPRNLRELCHTMESASLLRVGMRIGVDALPAAIAARAATTPYLGGAFTIEMIEREHILRVLATARSQEEASQILGIDTSTLWRKRKRY